LWNDLQGSIRARLAEYKAVDKLSRLELWAEENVMSIGGVTLRRFPQNRCIQISGVGPGIETLSLPANSAALETLVQRILEPLLFPETTAVARFI
jgi:hypothetical protein